MSDDNKDILRIRAKSKDDSELIQSIPELKDYTDFDLLQLFEIKLINLH